MGFKFDEETGKISAPLMHGGKFGFSADVDLKAFLQELHDALFKMGFKDHIPGKNVEVPYFKPEGEEPQAGDLKRTSDMYETKYVWLDKGKGAFEVEFHWVARKNTEMFGADAHLTFQLNLVNRFMTNKEVEINGQKKTFQSGTWEHRNKLDYENNAIVKKVPKFDKIPFLSNHFLIKTYGHIFMKQNIEHDIALMNRKVNQKLWDIIKKHFSTQ